MTEKRDADLTEGTKEFLDGLALKHFSYSVAALTLLFTINTCAVKENIRENTKAVKDQTEAIREQTRVLENKNFIVPAPHAR